MSQIAPRGVQPGDQELLRFTYAGLPWVLLLRPHPRKPDRQVKSCQPIGHRPSGTHQWLKALRKGMALLDRGAGRA